MCLNGQREGLLCKKLTRIDWGREGVKTGRNMQKFSMGDPLLEVKIGNHTPKCQRNLNKHTLLLLGWMMDGDILIVRFCDLYVACLMELVGVG